MMLINLLFSIVFQIQSTCLYHNIVVCYVCRAQQHRHRGCGCVIRYSTNSLVMSFADFLREMDISYRCRSKSHSRVQEPSPR